MMPELPEVETIVRGLKNTILKKKIIEIDIGLKKIVKSSLRKFKLDLKNNKFTDIKRRGKLFIFELAREEKYLLIHLRMTGQLIYKKNKKITAGGHGYPNDFNDLPNKHSHIIFYFKDGSQLFFNDQRQFGVIQLVHKDELKYVDAKFGVEPLDRKFTIKKFKDILKTRKGSIKAFLLNQKFIAGLGNIYTDEVLFFAGVLPNRKIDSLSEREIGQIHKGIKSILAKAIKYRGTAFNNYVDVRGRKGNFLKMLKVYRREGEKCLRCKKNIIQKTKIAGRGTRFCKTCQN